MSKGRDKSAVRIFSVRHRKNMSNGKNTAKVEGVFTGVCALDVCVCILGTEIAGRSASRWESNIQA